MGKRIKLKGRYVPEKKLQIYEIDCGMGMKEIRAEIREIQAITMMPRKMPQPKWKKPVIIASLVAAAAAMGLSLSLMILAPAFGALAIISLAWIAFVAYANRSHI